GERLARWVELRDLCWFWNPKTPRREATALGRTEVAHVLARSGRANPRATIHAMVAQPSARRMSEHDYLAWEEEQPARHEWYRGEVIDVLAMAGGSLRHSLLCANLIALLHAALRGKPCRVHTSDQLVYIEENHFFAYPDVTVLCGEPELK